MRSQVQVENGVGRSRIEDNEWELFVDPDEHPEFFEHTTEPVLVQFLGESWENGPWVVPNRFGPNVRADRHAHDYDTVYYILRGSMTFNDPSGWYREGDLRWVRAGVEYGPEEAGPEGCDFLLISYGPHNVQWADETPA